MSRMMNRMLNRRPGLKVLFAGALVCAMAAFGALHAKSAGAPVGTPVRTQAAAQPGAQHSVAITVDDLPGALPGNDFAYGELKNCRRSTGEFPQH